LLRDALLVAKQAARCEIDYPGISFPWSVSRRPDRLYLVRRVEFLSIHIFLWVE
jgi:hypothetical protein